MGTTGRPAVLGDPWLGRASENPLGVFMYAFVADQLLGINGLVNISNIVFLAAYSVRDVLWLRLLAIVGEILTLPYYYFQNEKLWPPIFWGVAFIMVNSVRIVAIALERRPVVHSDKEEQLYGVAFSSIDKREFLRLVSLARWVDCSVGDVILKKGQQITDAIVLISGDLEAILSSKTRLALRPGQLVGDVSAYSGLASPMDVVASGPGTLAKWDLGQLREFTANRPELRAKLLHVVSLDLSVKLRHVASAVSDFTAGEVTSEPPPSGA
jgi:CRP-like cAMP-binding protein